MRLLSLNRWSLYECYMFFFFNDTATTEIYTFPYTTLFRSSCRLYVGVDEQYETRIRQRGAGGYAFHTVHRRDRKSTRLNSSHDQISYAVFCLKKKKRDRASTHAADCFAIRAAPSPHGSSHT